VPAPLDIVAQPPLDLRGDVGVPGQRGKQQRKRGRRRARHRDPTDDSSACGAGTGRAADSSPRAAPPPCAGRLVTSADRARWLPPSGFAYVFSDSLAAIVRWVNRSRHWAAGHLVKAVRAIPGVVVAIPSALITLVWSAGLSN
jgi:hypothetical protein